MLSYCWTVRVEMRCLQVTEIIVSLFLSNFLRKGGSVRSPQSYGIQVNILVVSREHLRRFELYHFFSWAILGNGDYIVYATIVTFNRPNRNLGATTRWG